MSEERDALIPYCETCKHWDASRTKTWGVCTRHSFATDPDEACREWQAKEVKEADKTKRREWVNKVWGVSVKDLDSEGSPDIVGHVREVLPGDCDPDVVREVVREMREQLYNHLTHDAYEYTKKWADRLEGKQ